tara:strand:+ start:78 stop:317 length:240 start_codon:yes stop_codon:yes gene_type:complete
MSNKKIKKIISRAKKSARIPPITLYEIHVNMSIKKKIKKNYFVIDKQKKIPIKSGFLIGCFFKKTVPGVDNPRHHPIKP